MSKQGHRVLVALRKMIVSGDLRPGERVAEIPIADQLGVSRMPVRMAFRALESEGLLRKAGARGYMVREFSAQETADAVEVRGVLEGLAARLAAERGLSRQARAVLLECLVEGDALFAKGRSLSEEDIGIYHNLNMRFHQTVIEASRNAAIPDALNRINSIPFASANSIAVDCDMLDREFYRLYFAHIQHHVIFDALVDGHGSRAESVMREHANAALRYVDLFTDPTTPPENYHVIVEPSYG